MALEGKAAVFDLEGLAAPTGVVIADGYLVINARADGKITDLAIEFQHMVTEAGFDVAGSDDEGFEAEVFFAQRRRGRGAGRADRVASAQASSTCKISVLDDPAVFPDESASTAGLTRRSLGDAGLPDAAAVGRREHRLGLDLDVDVVDRDQRKVRADLGPGLAEVGRW